MNDQKRNDQKVNDLKVNGIGVMFVCLGNICRSPSAHGVFEYLVKKHKLQQHIRVDSAATGDWQIGKSPDPRAFRAAKNRGYDLSRLRARQIQPGDFLNNNYVLAMDHQNLADLQRIKPRQFQGGLHLFLELAKGRAEEVPDPYHGREDDFEQMLDVLEPACEMLLQQLITTHRL